MDAINATFVMCLLALVLVRVPQREWLSSAIAAFVLGLVGEAAGHAALDIAQGGFFGRLEALALVAVGVIGAGSVRRAWGDILSPPDRR